MCAIISEHPHKKLENLLVKFEKNFVFEDFVKALEYAIAKNIDNSFRIKVSAFLRLGRCASDARSKRVPREI